jgi:hypothetical protein
MIFAKVQQRLSQSGAGSACADSLPVDVQLVYTTGRAGRKIYRALGGK